MIVKKKRELIGTPFRSQVSMKLKQVFRLVSLPRADVHVAIRRACDDRVRSSILENSFGHNYSLHFCIEFLSSASVYLRQHFKVFCARDQVKELK